MSMHGWFRRRAAGDAVSVEPHFVAQDGAGVVTTSGIVVPAAPAAVEPHVIYDSTPRGSFVQVATELGHLNAAAAALLQKQAPRGEGVADLAVRLGVMTPAQAHETSERQTLVVHVDGRHKGTAAFLTWQADLRRAGIPVRVVEESAPKIADLQREHTTVRTARDADIGLQTLGLAKRLFEDAAAMDVSDVHILRRATHTEVQVRQMGDLRVLDGFTMKAEEGDGLIRAIYTGLAGTKSGAKGVTYNPLEFQHAQIDGYQTLPGTGLSGVRIVRGPAYPAEAGGGFLVARLQYGQRPQEPVGRILATRGPDQPEGQFRPEALGFTALQCELLDQLLRLPNGIVLVTGPTGSGKTTTLYELMRQQARLFPESRQITMEDPPEYPMPWGIQLAAPGDQFQALLRETLRMDPDVLQVGELRSANEVIAALQAAVTGHFVWSTMHVTDPYQVFARMEMLDPVSLRRVETCDPDKIVGLVAQRLVKVLCERCSVPLASSEPGAMPRYMLDALRTWLTAERELQAVRLAGPGCAHCSNGSKGRIGVAEVVLTDDELMDALVTQGVPAARRMHRQRPGSDRSMLGNAMPLILQGAVSPMDVHRTVHKIVPKEAQ
jgi:type II secretory ATPase GspE/PulE/Tfp pilus assembly ATPase PilB-like protein